MKGVERLTKTQLSVLASYSMPFVLLSALVINSLLQAYAISGGLTRLVFLSGTFPIGFSIGREIYLRRSHVEILFDGATFRIIKGSKEIASGSWRSYRHVSIVLDQYGRPILRLYKSIDGEHVDLPVFKTNARPQEFRNHVQQLLFNSDVATGYPSSR